MNANTAITKSEDTRMRISTLWIVVMLNMIAIDVLSLYIPGSMDQMAAFLGDTPVAPFMLIAAVLMEIPIVMIFLTRILKYRINRWANIVASVITIVFIVGLGSDYPHYLFMGSVEALCMLLIIWTAWKWSEPVSEG